MSQQVVNPNLDLLIAIQKPIEEMSDEELKQAYLMIRELRKVKFITKKKSALDEILENLTPDVSRQILQQVQDILKDKK